MIFISYTKHKTLADWSLMVDLAVHDQSTKVVAIHQQLASYDLSWFAVQSTQPPMLFCQNTFSQEPTKFSTAKVLCCAIDNYIWVLVVQSQNKT